MDAAAGGGQAKRRFERKQFRAHVGVFCQGHLHFVDGVEISEGGILLRSAFPVGEKLEICFFLADGGFISSFGEVAYTLEPELGPVRHSGIRFTKTPSEAQARIRNFVSSGQ